jgi:hypothetical protein
MVHEHRLKEWKYLISQTDSIPYHANGARKISVPYTCRVTIRNFESTTIGYFMPNRQTLDSNSNRRLDILRCSIPSSPLIYKKLVESKDFAHVELTRDGSTISKFVIPLEVRREGYLMSGPSASTQFDAWKGYDPVRHSVITSPPSDGDELHICAARPKNTYGMPDKIFQYMEFLEHSVLLGAGHVFLSVDFSWDSRSMRHIVKTLSRYIDSGKLTIMSEAGDNINQVSSIAGMTWDYVSVRNIQINSCLYLSKGTATYLGVWDVNEFFIPKPPHNNIMDVIRAASSASSDRPLHPTDIDKNQTVTSWKGGRGWADGDGHPFCYLGIGVRLTKRPSNALHPSHSIGIDSPVSPLELNIKSILPTKRIFQGGLHSAGGCSLDPEWTGCSWGSSSNSGVEKSREELCFRKIDDEYYAHNQFIANKNPTVIPAMHAIDDVVFDRDRKKLNIQTEGYLIEFASSIDQPLLKSDIAVLGETENEYAKRYASKVLSGLSVRVPDLTTISPIPGDDSPPFFDSSKWTPFSTVFPKPPPSVAAKKQQAALISPAVVMDSEVQFIFNVDNIFEGSSNGPHNFTEDFARPDVLDNPSSGVLPAFAKDYSDVGLGSIIEREHNSWNLFVTTFFLQHWMLWSPPHNYGMSKLYAKNKEKWERASRVFNNTQYEDSGARNTRSEKYQCRLKVSADAKAYSVMGSFMPNALTPDRNANRRVDIMRCQVLNSMYLYRHLSVSNESLHVEILKDDVVMFEFAIPWKTRRTGYTLSSPAVADTFNAWKGFDPSAPSTVLPGSAGGDKLYMCVPGVESPLSQLTVTRYAEFFQHHLLLGVEHFFVGGTYAWNGKNMGNLLALLHTFIDEGVMTVSSLAGDNVDLLYSILGLSTDRDNAKVMHVNMCLYLAKGVADYVAVWDTDEYFIPKPPHHTIMDVIRSAESPQPLQPFPNDTDVFALSANWKGGRGWADGHAHPFCYLHLTSDCIFRKDGNPQSVNKVSWIGEDFDHLPEPKRRGLSFQKSILPTRIIFQAGLHVGAACHLGPSWGNCDKTSPFCHARDKVEYHGYSVGMKDGQKTAVDFSVHHQFDGIVFSKDAKKIDPVTEALIYHIQVYRADVLAKEEVANNPAKNEYAARFWPTVKAELSRRGLYVLATLPEHVYNRDIIPGDTNWLLLWPKTQQYILSGDNAALDRLEPSPESFYGKPGLLPHFVRDHSDVILGAIVERQAESYNLHLVTFFMAHEQTANYTGKISNRAVRPDSLGAWMRAIRHSRGVNYTVVGERNDGHVYTCVLSNRNGSAFYTVNARFLPNEMTPDVNANKRLDILRCPIRDSQDVYNLLSRTDEHLTVKIFRDSYEVTHFTVPWRSRRTGYMLSTPPDMSRLDTWKGFDPNKVTSKSPADFSGDDLHMCVPGMESAMSKRTVALYAEFMQHHYNVGVKHMYVAATYSWGGVNMERYLGAFRSYIDDGMLSVSSSAGDEDLLYGAFLFYDCHYRHYCDCYQYGFGCITCNYSCAACMCRSVWYVNG